MKLNYDLIREILMFIEEKADGDINYTAELIWEERFTSYDNRVVYYHVKYLCDASFIESSNGYIIDITPNGRGYLDNIRNSNIWEKTKDTIKPLGNVTFGVISEVAKHLVTNYLGLR